MDRMCRIILLCFNDVYLWEWDNLRTFSCICFLWCLHLKQTHLWVPAQRSPPSRDYILEAPSLLTVLAPGFPPMPSDAICPVCLQRPWASRGQGLGLIATVPWYGRGPGKLPAQSMKKVVTWWASHQEEGNSISSLNIYSGLNALKLIGGKSPEGLLPFSSGPKSALQHHLSDP